MLRCTQEEIWNMVVDLRVGSPTRYRWHAVELAAGSHLALYSKVLYQMSTPCVAESARGLRWDDPRLGVSWPLAGPIISDRDRSFPLLP